MFFRPDIAIRPVKRVIEAPEFARVDHAIFAEMLFHGADFVLFLQQFAEFESGQMARTLADADALHLSILACVDLLAIRPGLLVRRGVALAATVPGGLCAGCRQAENA
jgi:hypothetical protein